MKRTTVVEGRVFYAWLGGCLDVASLSEHLHSRPEVVRAAVASFNEKQKAKGLGERPDLLLIDVKEKMTEQEWAAERERALDMALDAVRNPIEGTMFSPYEAASCYSTLRIHISEYDVQERMRYDVQRRLKENCGD